jgi:hypothetical protein
MPHDRDALPHARRGVSFLALALDPATGPRT